MPWQPAISSMSLGRAWEHALFNKLTEASKAGFEGIEIFYEDLAYLASTYDPATNDQSSERPSTNHLLRAAADITTWCQDLKLQVICLQPFMSYEGLIDRVEHAAKIEELKVWFKLCKVLKTDLILVPSTFKSEETTTANRDVIVEDMREIADLGEREDPPIRFAYENLAWGTHIWTWEAIYAVVERVGRPNFGMCLDTFNICGRIWADPSSPDGKITHAEESLDVSITRLVETVNPEKIFFIQVTDAERMREPLVEGHEWWVDGQPARMSWSRNARLFAGEQGGYLPVRKLLSKIFRGLGWQGWVSMELFSRTMAESDETVPEWHAKRGIQSWERLKSEYKLW